MALQIFSLVNWGNGMVMMAVFAMVCVALVITLVIFMKSGKKE